MAENPSDWAPQFKKGGTMKRKGVAKLHKGEKVGKREQDETPQYEARNHSAGFLKKAARLAGKKRGRGRSR